MKLPWLTARAKRLLCPAYMHTVPCLSLNAYVAGGNSRSTSAAERRQWRIRVRQAGNLQK